MNNIALCTASMNREHLLEEALQTWVKLSFNEIIIVDWSSTIPLNDMISKYQNGNIFLLRVNGKEKYNQSKASNLKVRFSTSEYVLSIDSDIKLNEDFLETHIPKNGFFFSGTNNRSTTGTCMFSRDIFNIVNGYNELMEGWGYHDIDFYNRLKLNDQRHIVIDKNKIKHIDHDNISRTENYNMKNMTFSNTVNRRVSTKTPWDISYKMEQQEVIIYYPDGKIETRII